jgi:lipopolysaccharide export system permease protein
MEDVIISDSRIGKEPSTIIARKAYLVADPRQMTVTLRLENGSTHIVDTKLKNYRKMDFSLYDLNLDIESSIAEAKKVKTKDSDELTIWELSRKLKAAGLEDAVFREMAIEFYKAMSTPFSCIIFGIIGVPLGIRSHRSVKARGFIVGLLIVFIYYIIRLGGEALAETGRLSPFIGTWAPNITFFLIGLCLFIMAVKDRSFNIQSIYDHLRKRMAKRNRD